ncbi:hypothetical protein BWP24_06505 [Vibrio campbellii]|nr:hypothetical protein BWP24_06505 [Vibrio campbellii]
MELTTPEKTSFQRVNRLLYRQTHRAELQPKTDSRLPCSVSIKEQNNRENSYKTLDLKQLKLSSDDRRLIGVPSKQLLNIKLRNMILIASFFWRLTPC